ncbi:hypothetical protein HK096_009320 [Nowakowskiella sp. JEL0078]|nr:hypothetical protein HK096_009320 [Nowakowskiella sp. JEL0078]
MVAQFSVNPALQYSRQSQLSAAHSTKSEKISPKNQSSAISSKIRKTEKKNISSAVSKIPAVSLDSVASTADVAATVSTTFKLASGKNENSETTNQRGVGYTEEEDYQLCRSYAVVTCNAIAGNEQKIDVFWTAIKNDYDKNVPIRYHDGILVDRTISSLNTHFNIISRTVSKFAGIIAMVERNLPSGYTRDDIYQRAIESYDKEKPVNGMKWKWKRCWEVLRELPKFQVTIEESKSNAQITERLSTERPPGRKAEKRRMKEHEAENKINAVTIMSGLQESSKEVSEAIKVLLNKQEESQRRLIEIREKDYKRNLLKDLLQFRLDDVDDDVREKLIKKRRALMSELEFD